MELEKLLEKSLKKRFKANAIVEALESKIKNKIEENVYNKYCDDIVYLNENNSLQFKLYKVKVDIQHYQKDISLNNASIKMAYFCISKLPKRKKDRIEECKLYFDKYGRTKWNNFKIPIWETLHYEIPISRGLTGNFNFKIEI